MLLLTTQFGHHCFCCYVVADDAVWSLLFWCYVVAVVILLLGCCLLVDMFTQKKLIIEKAPLFFRETIKAKTLLRAVKCITFGYNIVRKDITVFLYIIHPEHSNGNIRFSRYLRENTLSVQKMYGCRERGKRFFVVVVYVFSRLICT